MPLVFVCRCVFYVVCVYVVCVVCVVWMCMCVYVCICVCMCIYLFSCLRASCVFFSLCFWVGLCCLRCAFFVNVYPVSIVSALERTSVHVYECVRASVVHSCVLVTHSCFWPLCFRRYLIVTVGVCVCCSFSTCLLTGRLRSAGRLHGIR